MKKILFPLFLLFLMGCTQNSKDSEHLQFKGIPINGTLESFVSKMEDAGYEVVDKEDGIALMRGEFAGSKNCELYVSAFESIDVVNFVGVMFPSNDDSDLVKRDYDKLKTMLTEKYGTPVVDEVGKMDRIENFIEEEELYIPEDLYADTVVVHADTMCFSGHTDIENKYGDEPFAVFSTSKGNIEITITKNRMYSDCVLIRYYDKKNTERVVVQAKKDL